ncbi:MAG: aminotransferase class V-fold PLP-dependent enzyme, partial [Clostridiales bacterium]|nr:aminotransferase class V-fold PLP-dependent enzyme [Clostridiales bacterium]
ANVYPSAEAIDALKVFDEPMPDSPGDAMAVLDLLGTVGSDAAVAQSGGKYFGFVCGSLYPVALAGKWLSDTWDQNSALYVLSPIAAKLEEVCENWIVDILGLPEGTAAGFVSGSSVAIICALVVARNEILLRNGWDVHARGLFGAPPIRVVIGTQAHSSVYKALSFIGLGKDRIEFVPVDDQGRMLFERLPDLDANTLLIIQAGNVNSGAFDPIDALCDAARKAGTWVHVDGAFGLWAAASENTRHLTRGIEKADSWSVDAHKTLNAPYDCGIVLVKDADALTRSMQATASYVQYSENRDGMLYTPEMSRRARSIELWATLKYLGRSGLASLVDQLCDHAKYFASRLSEQGFIVPNNVVFNQILVQCESPEKTRETLSRLQNSGKLWCGGTVWKDLPAIRISVCSWQTTYEDIDDCVQTLVECRDPD